MSVGGEEGCVHGNDRDFSRRCTSGVEAERDVVRVVGVREIDNT